MQAISSRFTVATVCFFLAACGGSSSNNSPALAGDDNSVLSGVLLAPRIAGLDYGSGTTTANGSFTLTGGSTLNTKLGSLELASTTARSRLSVFDLVGSAEQYRFDKAVRVGRVLISLDSDDDARNGVELSNTAAFAGELDWQYSDSLWQSAADALLNRLSDGSKSLISAADAMQTMTSHQRAESETCDSALSSTGGFAIADPSCSDRARLQFWRDDLSPALTQLQLVLDQFLDRQLTVDQWWSSNSTNWQSLLAQSDKTQAWLSYALAGADVATRNALESAISGGSALSGDLQSELERWRDGGAIALRERDQQERVLASHVLTAWLSYGFDQQALRTAYGLSSGTDWQGFIIAVAARQSVPTTSLRLAVVDEQVYRALQLIDSLMASRATWVTGGSSQSGDGLSDDGGDGGDDSNDDPARVWRVSYGALAVGGTAEFTVEGSALDSDVSVILAACSNMQALSGTSSQRVYQCDINGAAGGRVLQVIDDSDGSLLYEAIVTVAEGLGDDGSDAVVNSVSPSKAERSSTQLFTVLGSSLALDTSFSLAGCASPQVQSRSSTQIEVLCELDDRATVRAGEISTADGSVIYNFNVSPVVIEEDLIRVVDVEPAAALEAETLDILLSGSGFSSNATVQTSACENTVVLSQSDAQIRFSCRNAQIGTWPVYVVSEQQTVLAPQSIQVRAVEAVVNGVTPLSGQAGKWVNLKVSGQYLSEGLEIDLDACAELEELDGTSVQRQFGCTLQTAGVHQGQVLAGDRLLYRFDFTVEAAPAARVLSVSPTSSVYGEPLQLTFTGEELPESAQVELELCNSMSLLSASSSKLVFSCTPQRVGTISGKLLDGDGEDLVSFTVDIVEGGNPLEDIVIDSVTPDTTYLDAVTTFTVRGEDLPASLVLTVEGCTEVQRLGGHSEQRQFRCTPKGDSGQRTMQLYASAGGVLLGSYDLMVTGNEIRVSDISPKKSAIGVRTVFRVTGQNLSSAMVLQLDDCDARLTSSSGSETRIYQCTPYGLPGTRTAKVLDRSGGTVLYSTSIDILKAP